MHKTTAMQCIKFKKTHCFACIRFDDLTTWKNKLSFYLLRNQTEGVRAKVYFKATPSHVENELTYLKVEDAKMDFSVKQIQMGVENVANGNSVIRKLSKNSVNPSTFR